MTLSPLRIILEDDAFACVEKPGGLPTLPEEGGITPTFADMVKEHFPSLGEQPECGIAHRLDNDTSGLITIGKTPESYEALRNMFQERKIKKGYIALVLGHPPDQGVVTTPIAHHPQKKKKMIVDQGGRPAKTIFRTVERYRSQDTDYSLLTIEIESGVRHQIRAHLASLGNPIAGDRLYQNAQFRTQDTLPLSRHFLHAYSLSFPHPVTGELVNVTCDLSADLSKILSLVRSVPS